MLTKLWKGMRSPQERKNIKFAIASKMINPILRKMGYTLIADHYYQPIPNEQEVLIYQNKERPLKFINWNLAGQIEFANYLLTKYKSEFNNPEIMSVCGYNEKVSQIRSGDSEFLYCLIRENRPQKIIEIGSGGSTQVIAAALKQNFSETKEKAKLISIEPYPWESIQNFQDNYHNFMEFSLLETPVQNTELSIFETLKSKDILFVDSSHVFKQGSDVEFEFLQIYPILKQGVFVHIHDIFFPFDYPVKWNNKWSRFWNEQYFLELFLQFNNKFEVVTSLSMLAHYQNSVLSENINVYEKNRIPGSFWMKVVSD
ncbi:class I SAM-dependent methyltransferase [Argonema antarcticum]|uniref:class I SAM-dependent methyltransferase n=1 Tax=Argonema antarcticum TaxID=2942763 RepID=UPI002013189C|nr:class I SAM-dependent methyltransferase [Argonema antarcticum]MCL1474926.1 class I SAM-dependent methyltransferase [Argonema antarcticum A004/B2]